jgi:hypothetical protein
MMLGHVYRPSHDAWYRWTSNIGGGRSVVQIRTYAPMEPSSLGLGMSWHARRVKIQGFI